MTRQESWGVVCRAVSIAHGSNVVVEDLDLSVRRGETVALLGPSGSGKSTILAALAGFLTIRSGEITIGGHAVAGPGRHEPPERRDVAVVFQSYALWPHLSALQTVAFPLHRRGLGEADARMEASRILDALGIASLAARRPAEMSGGEQQRVGLGRAMARNASVALFDEPTAHLDMALRERLQHDLFEHGRGSGATMIYATHDATEALALADRVVLIRDGRIVQQGTPAAVYESPVDLWAARLTGPAWTLPLRLSDVRDGTARVELDGMSGLVRAGSSSRLEPGTVEVMIRPDWARLGGDLMGRVEFVSFRGTHTDYQLSTEAGPIGLRVLGPPTVSGGESVGWTLERVWAFGVAASGHDDISM